MLRLGCRTTTALALRRRAELVRHTSSTSHHPNAPLELDPAFQALLRDVEISLRNKNSRETPTSHGPRELELFPHDPHATVDYLTSAELDAQDDNDGRREGRKSPAAAILAEVVIPIT